MNVPTTIAQAACDLQPGGFRLVPTWYKYLEGERISGKCSPVFSVTSDIPKILLAVFEIVLFVGGIVAVVFILYGGFQYMIAQGEPEKAKNARTTIINAVIGLVITVSATIIVNIVARTITGR